jgi:amidophosphoribosyltransferase
MDELKHECGIAALYHFDETIKSRVHAGPPDKAHELMPRMLVDLQNRGQLAAGMSSYNPDRDCLLETYKEVGLVAEAFRMSQVDKYEKILAGVSGRAAIGHTRYATSGPTTKAYAQPFERKHGCKWKWFAFAFNGNLANLEELRAEIESLNDYHLTRDNDTEAMLHLISLELMGATAPDIVEVFTRLAAKFDGSYNIVFLNAMGEMVVCRDPLGLRPVSWAVEGGVFGAASESMPLQNLGFRDVRSLEPGELVLVKPGSYEVHRFAESRQPKHCFFEWVYFANVASTLDDRSVYLTRTRLGQALADQERKIGLIPDLDDGNTIVVPVPDTAKAAADGMAYKLGLPSMEGLMRNRYVGRTFIESAKRGDKVRLKFTPLREVLEGKRVILVEDSIVRSTTLANLLGFLKERGGAKEVHVRVACPPIVAPCFYGIDMSDVAQLFAPRHMKGDTPTRAEQARMAEILGATTLAYLPLEAIAKCIDLPEDRLCRACVTGQYPTPKGEESYLAALAAAEATGGNGRAYGRRPLALV